MPAGVDGVDPGAGPVAVVAVSDADLAPAWFGDDGLLDGGVYAIEGVVGEGIEGIDGVVRHLPILALR